MRYAARAPRPLCVGIVRLRRFPFSSSPLRPPHLLIPLRVRISTRGEEEKRTPRRASFVLFIALDGQQPCRLIHLAPAPSRAARSSRSRRHASETDAPGRRCPLPRPEHLIESFGGLRPYCAAQTLCLCCPSSYAHGPLPRSAARAYRALLPVRQTHRLCRARAPPSLAGWKRSATHGFSRPPNPLGMASEVNRGQPTGHLGIKVGQKPCKSLDRRRRRPRRNPPYFPVKYGGQKPFVGLGTNEGRKSRFPPFKYVRSAPPERPHKTHI